MPPSPAIRAAAMLSSISRHLSMASVSSANVGAAPWREHFLEDISHLSKPICSLATLHPISLPPPSNPTSSSGECSPNFVPRVRTVVYRGMWATLPENKHNPAPRNPAAYESDMPVFTTDARMEKVAELASTGSLASDPKSGSCGGGAAEAVFWVPDTQTQWRLRGPAYLIAPDIEGDDDNASKAVRDVLLQRMRETGENSGTWSWARELTAHFGNLSPAMRGTFKNPPPGRPKAEEPQDPNLGLGQRITDLQDPTARENFRALVLIPNEVDVVDLSNQRRWVYRLMPSDEGGEWETCEVWP